MVMAVVMDQARCRTASNQCEEQSPCPGITALRAEFAVPRLVGLQLASVFTALAFLALIRARRGKARITLQSHRRGAWRLDPSVTKAH